MQLKTVLKQALSAGSNRNPEGWLKPAVACMSVLIFLIQIYLNLLGTLDRIASRHGVSIANVATRWTLERSGVAAAIVGAFDAGHLEDNLRVFALELTKADLESLEPFADAGPAGDVYAAERVPDGRHAAIMKYNLNSEAQP